MKKKLNDKGFTLIELIMFIIVGAIFIPVSLIAFTSVMSNYSRPDYYVKARFYAEERMSEITSLPYDKIIPGQFDWQLVEESGGYETKYDVIEINPVDLGTTSTSPSDYKRITVAVQYSGLWGGPYTVSTIVTRRP